MSDQHYLYCVSCVLCDGVCDCDACDGDVCDGDVCDGDVCDGDVCDCVKVKIKEKWNGENVACDNNVAEMIGH